MRKVICLIGLFLGLALAVIAILATGAGHGSYFLLRFASAPFGFLGALAGVLYTPILWFSAVYLASKHQSQKATRIFIILMAMHYIGAFLLAVDPYVDFEYAMRDEINGAVTTGIFVYVLTQFYLWFIFIWTRLKSTK
ncbi:MAG TPA: hypothetical protein VEF04_17480 [Blastocatellia bacterium]|nr:hypothetical protein [Blastocatellia bacterium]